MGVKNEEDVMADPITLTERGTYLLEYRFAPCGPSTGHWRLRLKNLNTNNYVNFWQRDYLIVVTNSASWDGYYGYMLMMQLEAGQYAPTFQNNMGATTSTSYNGTYSFSVIKLSTTRDLINNGVLNP